MSLRLALNRVSWLNVYLLIFIAFANPVFAQEDVFEYGDFSVKLPKGWAQQEVSRGAEKELIGSLKSEDLPGTTVLIFFYKDSQFSYSDIRLIGLKTIASVFPKGQEMLKGGMKVITDGGLAAVIELWRGLADVKGTSAFLRVPMGIIGIKRGWIVMLGFTPESTGAQLEEAFSSMIRSAR
jgi:hypothetical protein